MLEEEDVLGTTSYVNTLYEIINTCGTPFTIGLFGGWGTGKSSIVKTVNNKLKEEKKEKIEVITYDAWKYSKDSFRRTFLLEILKETELEETKKLENAFYKEESEEIGHKPKVRKDIWLKIIYLIFLTILIACIWIFVDEELDLKLILMGLGIISAALIFFIQEFTVIYKTTRYHPRIFNPEQFESIFYEMIEELTSKERTKEEWIKKGSIKKKLEKVVIIIDNLDRCRRETAIELMLTIKNFLEIKECIYVIPVDNLAIKQFLDENLKNSNKHGIEYKNSDEFLRKFFNIVIRIKSFTSLDLFDFATKLNQKYNLNFNSMVLEIGSYEYAKNPRRIIQFLNNLKVEYQWFKNAENLGYLPKNFATENVEFIAKMMIIREEWPHIYREIEEDENNLSLIEKTIQDLDLEGSVNASKLKEKAILRSMEEYYFFLKTKPIKTQNIEIFINIRDKFSELPYEIENYILNQDFESIKNEISKGLDVEKFIDFIKQIFEKQVVRRKRIDIAGYNILSIIIKLYLDTNILENPFESCKRLLQFFEPKYLTPVILDLNVNLLMKFSRNLYDNRYEEVSRVLLEYITALTENDLLEDKQNQIITLFIINFQDVHEYLKVIAPQFSILVLSNTNILEEISNILENKENTIFLLEKDSINHIVNNISQEPASNYTKFRIKILTAIIGEEKWQDEVGKLISKITTFANTTSLPHSIYWLDVLSDFIRIEYLDKFPQIYQMLVNRNSHLMKFLSSKVLSEQQKESLQCFLTICQKLAILDDERVSQIFGLIDRYFVEDIEELFESINSFYQEIFTNNIIRYWDFSSTLFLKFKSSDHEDKKPAMGETVSLMLENNKSIEYLNQEFIDEIFIYLFSILFDGEDDLFVNLAEKMVQRLLNFEHLIDTFFSRINQLHSRDMDTIIQFISKIKKVKIKKAHYENILHNTEDVSKLTRITKRIIELTPNENQILKEILFNLLPELDTEDTIYYKKILEICVNNIELFSEEEKGEIADKISFFLKSGKRDQNFALKQLEKIDSLPKARRKAVYLMLEDLKNHTKKDEKEHLERVKEIYKG